RFQDNARSPWIDFHILVADESGALDGCRRIVVHLHTLVDFHSDDSHLPLLVYAQTCHTAHLDPVNFDRAAGPESGDRGEPGCKRVGVFSKERNLAELHGHIADAYETD